MPIQDEAALILQLYDLRREATMRTARDWYAREFNPESMADVEATLMGSHSAYVRMVTSYWDMAAALVQNGAISQTLFNDTNGEHFLVFGKLEPLLTDIRSAFGPQFLANLEKLIDATPGGRERAATARERMKAIRTKFLAAQAKTSA